MINFDFHEKFSTNNKVKTAQNHWELGKFLEWMQNYFKLNDTSVWETRKFKYLEIGSYAGESLYYVSQILPKGSTIVLVDLNVLSTQLGDEGFARNNLRKVIEWSNKEFNHTIALVNGDSRAKETIEQVTKICTGFDLCFIDGDHSFNTSYSDFVNYSPMSSTVALHDVSWHNIARDVQKYPPKGQPLVSHIWQSIKLVMNPEFLTEFVDNENTAKPRGFGILHGVKFE